MATMFPNRLSECEDASEGERLVYSFLKERQEGLIGISSAGTKEQIK